MEFYLISGLFGFIGGITRAFIGYLKAVTDKKKFNLKYFLLSFVASGLIGLFVGLVYDSNPKFGLVAGYAVTDILESIYKINKPY